MLIAMRGLAIAIVLAVTRTAVAAPADAAAEAGAAFRRGRELAKLGRFDAACEEFAKSYGLDPALGTALNLADCLERQHKLYRAWELFDLVARRSQSVKSRARLARRRADALAAKFAKLIIKVREPSAPGLSLRIGDRQITPAAEIRDLIEPRDVDVVASLPGRPAYRARLHPTAGTTTLVEIPAFVALPDAAAVTGWRRRSRVYLAGGAGAAGMISFGASLGLAISARRQYGAAIDGSCIQPGGEAACRREVAGAGHEADLATGFMIGGVVLVGAAAAVYFTAPREAIEIAPIATGSKLGLGVAGRF